ncbi:glutamyl-tRNA(Gln) amidotransferase subunit A, mitochondrial [Caerostris extrusa]|uniref:Glutamyl-tRNA(Gln) amidotransferase subunit A, mitochondrial n=1 Tax=Caerostris extrusa TaxID=172846 RepID=A0AAV4WPQ9_CAEEX|nr:glutamyl-tRNA(Gln) amidotransferase subunit A, mitochondrial [Caerostris extrusa]
MYFRNYEKYFLKAAKVRRLICRDFEDVFRGGVDLLLTPVTLSDAVPYSKWILTDHREHNAAQDFCIQSANMAGLPAVSIPCSLSKAGLPLSLQLIGKQFQEPQMLSAAKWIEQQMDFPIMDLECQ